jgi:hypothetical protein
VLKINNEKELVQFLKMIAENSVSKSKKILEKDPYINSFKDEQIKNKSIYEQDEEEVEESEEEESEAESKEKESEAEENNLTPAAEKAMNLPEYEGQPPEFESLLTAINLVRAGNSLKDKEVKTELKSYFDRLNQNEQSVLILFLKELAKITTLAIDGDEAQDPSDPSTYFNITKRNEEERKDKAAAIQTDTKQPQQGIPQQLPSAGPEDTSAPIKVNESQDITQIKKIIEMINS